MKPKLIAYYNDKIVEMPDSHAHLAERQRFSLACMRVLDNARDGYVLDGEKLYYVTRANKTARLLKGEERTKIMEMIGRT